MIRSLCLFFMVFGCFLNAKAQMFYVKQNLVNNNFIAITERSNNSGYIVLNSHSAQAGASVQITSQLLVLDVYGSLVDSVSLSPSLDVGSPILRQGSNYYVFGSQIKTHGSDLSFWPTIIKLDQDLNIIQRKALDSVYNNVTICKKIILRGSELYAGYSYIGTNRVQIFRLDANLGKLDSVSFIGSLDDLDNYGTNIAVIGYGFPLGSVNGNAQVAELDPSLNLVTRFNLDSLSSVNPGCYQKVGLSLSVNVIETGNNGLFVSGSFPVVQSASCVNKFVNVCSIIRNNSKVQKTQLIGNGIDETVFNFSALSSSKRYNKIYSAAISGYDPVSPYPPQSQNTRILVHKMDTAGNLLWGRYYGGDRYYTPYNILATADSGVVICGMLYDHSGFQVQNVCMGFVMKLDKNGDQVFVGIKENSSLTTQYHNCYPNPATNSLYFDAPFQNNMSLTIYDLNGREQIVQNTYTNLSPLNISGLKPGIHVYKINTGKTVLSGKFVKTD